MEDCPGGNGLCVNDPPVCCFGNGRCVSNPVLGYIIPSCSRKPLTVDISSVKWANVFSKVFLFRYCTEFSLSKSFSSASYSRHSNLQSPKQLTSLVKTMRLFLRMYYITTINKSNPQFKAHAMSYTHVLITILVVLPSLSLAHQPLAFHRSLYALTPIATCR